MIPPAGWLCAGMAKQLDSSGSFDSLLDSNYVGKTTSDLCVVPDETYLQAKEGYHETV
jgi:hypothetical protein